MKHKLPPLHLLGIFEAAARHQNFKAASEELFITPSAVSHQIKALEAYLGIDLFQRKSRGVVLNNAGDMYLKYIQQGFQSFDEGTAKLRHRFTSPALKISSFTTLASNVIIPQLGAFQAAHPDIDIRIETGNHVADLRYDDIDLAIRIGDGHWPKMHAYKLTDIRVCAVCSPQFAATYNPKTPSDINKLPLIDFSYLEDAWMMWANAIGTELNTTKRSLTFNDYDSAINAASQGLGMALAMFPFEKVQLQRGVIVAPFAEYLHYPKALYAVYREQDADRHEIKCFIDWLLKSDLTSL